MAREQSEINVRSWLDGSAVPPLHTALDSVGGPLTVDPGSDNYWQRSIPLGASITTPGGVAADLPVGEPDAKAGFKPPSKAFKQAAQDAFSPWDSSGTRSLDKGGTVNCNVIFCHP
jgi:hypothetical protein